MNLAIPKGFVRALLTRPDDAPIATRCSGSEGLNGTGVGLLSGKIPSAGSQVGSHPGAVPNDQVRISGSTARANVDRSERSGPLPADLIRATLTSVDRIVRSQLCEKTERNGAPKTGTSHKIISGSAVRGEASFGGQTDRSKEARQIGVIRKWSEVTET